jgi:hypothetical protein
MKFEINSSCKNWWCFRHPGETSCRRLTGRLLLLDFFLGRRGNGSKSQEMWILYWRNQEKDTIHMYAAAESLNTCGVHWFCSSNMCSPKEHGAGSSSIYSRRQINSYRFSHNSFMVYMDTCNKLTIHILKARCCNTYLMFLLKWMYSCTTRQYRTRTRAGGSRWRDVW